MSTNNCPNCGPYDCYRICPNHPEYYSVEQEMRNDASHDSRYEYYREGGFEDPDIYADRDDEEDAEAPMFEVVGVLTYDACTDTLSTSDDIPF